MSLGQIGEAAARLLGRKNLIIHIGGPLRNIQLDDGGDRISL